MDWLRIIMMCHHSEWHKRAFVYVIAGEKTAAFFRHLWIGRNFDFWASLLSLLVAGILFLAGYFPIDVANEKFARDLLVIGALIGFPILIKRVGEVRLQSRAMQYNAANELLWSKDKGSRMAGIEALWRFANTYPKEEYHNVMDVFTQFIKYPIPYEWKKGTQEEQKKAGKRHDIGKILQYMGKERMAGAKPYEINFINAHLEDAILGGAYLVEADLRGTHFEGAYLRDANLEGAYLSHVHLDRAYLGRSRLGRSHLERADLIGADLHEADLSDAYLQEADLSSSHLRGVNLTGSHLEAVFLRKANLRNTDLTLSIINCADFENAKNLRQEQINSCVFITDDDFFAGIPTLPKEWNTLTRK